MSIIDAEDSDAYVFKTAHGEITVTIINGHLHISCGMRSLAILPSSGNAILVHVCRTDINGCIYEPHTLPDPHGLKGESSPSNNPA